MADPIVLPELGAEEAVIRVSSWFVSSGDTVEVGDRVAEVQLPGMTFDVVTTTAGIVGEIEKPVEAIVQSGDVLGWVET